MADIKALAEELVNLSVKDVQELAQIFCKRRSGTRTDPQRRVWY